MSFLEKYSLEEILKMSSPDLISCLQEAVKTYKTPTLCRLLTFYRRLLRLGALSQAQDTLDLELLTRME